MLGIFATQAAVAIRASRVARGSRLMLRAALAVAGEEGPAGADLGASFASIAAELDGEDETPFWQLVDRLSALGDLSDPELELVTDILAVVARHRPRPSTYRRRTR